MRTPSEILVFDLETTIRAPAPHFGATPAWRGNRVVLAGFKADQRDITVTENLQALVNQIGPNTLIVGHNLGFDLHYLLREFDIPKSVSLWDTQKFDYLLCGRGARQPSLEKTALRMEVDFTKDSEVSERFKVGIGSDKIDRDLLTKYLVADVQTTYDIYVKQRATVTNDAKLAYLQELMNGIAVTTEMSCNGMPFSRLGAAAEAQELQAKHDDMYATAAARWTREWPDELPPLKLTSPAQITTLLWGGEQTFDVQENVLDDTGQPVRFKTGTRAGEVKTKKVTRSVTVKRLASPALVAVFDNQDWEKTSSIQTLKRIIDTSPNCEAAELARDLSALRQVTKNISTYFKPYVDHAIADTIHPVYNHCITQTGRLSSSKPNMQNISGKESLQ